MHIHAYQVWFGLGYVALAFIAGCIVGAWERWGGSLSRLWRREELVALDAPDYRWEDPE